jgi:hypothetical protein
MVYNAATMEDASAIQWYENIRKLTSLVHDISNNKIHCACQTTMLFIFHSTEHRSLENAKQNIEIIGVLYQWYFSDSFNFQKIVRARQLLSSKGIVYTQLLDKPH